MPWTEKIDIWSVGLMVSPNDHVLWIARPCADHDARRGTC